MNAAHYQLPGQYQGLTRPTACRSAGMSTLDLQAVTCRRCLNTTVYRDALAEFNDVVDALASPKEEHPCLSTSANPATRT